MLSGYRIYVKVRTIFSENKEIRSTKRLLSSDFPAHTWSLYNTVVFAAVFTHCFTC